MSVVDGLAAKAIEMGKSSSEFSAAAQKHANATWFYAIVGGLVWYFIGWLLLIYGILILGAGSGVVSAQSQPVMADLHIGIWWGALLMAIGLTYVYCFRPRR